MSLVQSDPDLCRITATESLHFEEMRRQPMAIFFCFPEYQARYYAFLGSILFSQVFSFCMESPERGDRKIFAILDELGNSSKIPGFPVVVSSARRRGISLSLILQDTQQLSCIYGQNDAHVIVNNCGSRIYLPGLSHSMCRDVSDALGSQTVIDRRNGQERRVTRPLLSPSEVRMLPDKKAILVSTNHAPVLLRMKPYYKIRKLRKRAEIPSPPVRVGERKPVEYINLQRDEPSSRPLPALQIDSLAVSSATAK